MNPKISITVDSKNKAVATITGMATVGAKIDVEVSGIASTDVPNWGSDDDYTGYSLRFRVVDEIGNDLVRYQLKKKTETTPDVWTWDSTNSKFTATDVDFDTDVLRKAFCGVPFNEALEFGLILDSIVDKAQYAVGKMKIRQWAVASTEDPTVLPDWRDVVARIDNASASVTKSGKIATISITDTHGTTTTATVSDGEKGEPGAGVPKSGASGQFLAKNSDADYDVKWADAIAKSSSIPALGTDPTDDEVLAALKAIRSICATS